MKINVIGGGIFGVTAALELQNRGHRVTVFEKGTLPEPKASSTDISKMIRADYGADELYTNMMVEAFEGWHRWNRLFDAPRYHEAGFLLLSRQPLADDSFEAESIRALSRKGFPLLRLTKKILKEKFPQWTAEHYPDGYFNPKAGWAESGAVVAELAALGKRRGVNFLENEGLKEFIFQKEKISGWVSTSGKKYKPDLIVLAAGTWSQHLLPDLHNLVKTIGQPVFHLLPENPEQFSANHFPGWAADISKTGWYGFPAQPNGIVKIANHGVGFEKLPDADAEIPAHYFEALRIFLKTSLPALAPAPVVHTRVCMYADTFDGNFLIDRHPIFENLLLATGGSGHGFKFAPVLGNLIADVAEGKTNIFAPRFGWRKPGEITFEAARCADPVF